MDPRHLSRIRTIQNLFAQSFEELRNNLPYPEDTKSKEIVKHLKSIDKLINTYAPRYPIKNIAKTDLAILRLSIYELMIEKKIPKKVVIDEAVELAKEMSGEQSYAFVNAVLGAILKKT